MNSNLLKKIIILSISFVLAIFLIKPIGVSTEYSVTSGIIEKTVNPNYNKHEYYNQDNAKILKAIDNPINYNMIFVFSIPFGGYLGYLFKKKKIKNTNQKKYEKKEYIKLFTGGFLLLFGARIAGGCTSGHMMSGIMQSSVSSIIFAIFVFATGIIFSIFLGGKNE